MGRAVIGDGSDVIDETTVRRQLAGFLRGISAEDIDLDVDLFDQGLDSLSAMELVQQARDAGHDVGYVDLLGDSTPRGWLRLLERRAAEERGA